MMIEIVASPATIIEIIPEAGPSVMVECNTAHIIELEYPGPQGPAGPSGEPISHTHIQPLAAEQWVINHNLGFRPSVSIYSVGGMEIEASVAHTSINQTVITFVMATAGTARCI